MDKRNIMITAALLSVLLLAGCTSGEPTPGITDPAPAQTEETPAAPAAPTPGLTIDDFIVDDTHDAFLVDTGGSLGRLWVMVDKVEEGLEFSVWNAENRTKPCQTFTTEGFDMSHFSLVADANFDGYPDFGYACSVGAANNYYQFWLWDEEQGLFVEAPELADVCSPQFDEETQTISAYTHKSAMSGVTSLYRWEDGKLVCIRQIDIRYPSEDGIQELVVSERIDGTLTEVYRTSFSWDTDAIFKEAERWQDLGYHGEDQ